MKKHLLRLTMPVMALTIWLLSCSKESDNQRTTTNPPTDTTSNPPVHTKKWIVSTLAGSGVKGKADGDSIHAEFSAPAFMTIDPQGNIFVSDLQNFNIRKITPGGHVSTYAGRDISTPDPAYGNIFSMALDKHGNLFDIEYSLIRKTTPTLDISVFAGSLLQSYKDTIGEYAAFNVTGQMTIDQNDNLYLTDYDLTLHPQVRKVTPDGNVTTLQLQDNTGLTDIALPNYYYVFPIVADRYGNLYKTSNGSQVIKKITPDGNVTVFAGANDIGFGDGQSTAAHFYSITSMATDSAGNLYISDAGNNAVRKVSTTGLVTTIAGTGEQGYADGEGSQAKFFNPSGIAVDKNGVIYVSDIGNNRIRKIEFK